MARKTKPVAVEVVEAVVETDDVLYVEDLSDSHLRRLAVLKADRLAITELRRRGIVRARTNVAAIAKLRTPNWLTH